MKVGWSRLLRSRNFDEQKTNKALETIERNAQAQTQIIEDLLDISRIIHYVLIDEIAHCLQLQLQNQKPVA